MTSKEKKQAALFEKSFSILVETEKLNALLEVLANNYFDRDINDVSDSWEEISEMVSEYKRFGILVHCAIDLVESIEKKVDGIEKLISESTDN